MLAGLLAAGTAGLDAGATLPEPGRRRPRVARRGGPGASAGSADCPTRLREAVDAFVADDVLTSAFGEPLTAAIRAVRESELELFDGASAEDVAAASRWAH